MRTLAICQKRALVLLDDSAGLTDLPLRTNESRPWRRASRGCGSSTFRTNLGEMSNYLPTARRPARTRACRKATCLPWWTLYCICSLRRSELLGGLASCALRRRARTARRRSDGHPGLCRRRLDEARPISRAISTPAWIRRAMGIGSPLHTVG